MKALTRRTAVGLGILGFFAVALILGAVWRASSIVNRLLREWAAGTIAQESEGVYELALGKVHFDWALRRVAVDTIGLATRRAVNERRPQSLPGVRLALYDCTISGVHFLTLIGSGGLVAGSFGCREGRLAVELPRDRIGADPDSVPTGLAFGERRAFLVFQQALRLPAYAPRVRIERVSFPRLALDVRLHRTTGAASRLQLERLEWTMADVVIDPADTTAAARPLFSRSVELVATNFVTHPDSATAMQVGLLRTSLTDSTLEIHDILYAPSTTGVEFRRAQSYRHDRISVAVGHLTAEGIDVGAFVLGQGVRARRVQVDSLRVDVFRDKRKRVDPVRTAHRTPQQWVANLDETLSLDSLLVHGGQVVYREHAVGRAQPGVVTFARIEAQAANISHFVGRWTNEDPMTLTARAQVQGVGRLDVRATVPLDGPRFDLSFSGALGPMPASAFNAFVVPTAALQVESGQVAGAAFSVSVRNGVATGTITPLFNDLTVSVTRSGSDGILGGGGFVGGAARRVASFASRFKLRDNNPDRPLRAPMAGTIHHTFTPDETLIAFLWNGVRDGMLTVMKR